MINTKLTPFSNSIMNISKKIPVILLLISTAALAKYSSQISISRTADCIKITSNGIPDHNPGTFPNSHNPNTISEQNYSFCVPANPKIAGAITELGHDLFGIAINGVVFDPETAEYWHNDRNSGWNFDALAGGVDLGMDSNNAHVQPGGAYHYHGLPYELLANQEKEKQTAFIGFAADGFPIYSCCTAGNNLKSSYRVKEGYRESGPGGKYNGYYNADYEYVKGAGDLDQCNGTYGVTKEYPKGTYYYVITKEFPNIPRCFKGTPDSSFKKQMGRGRGRNPMGAGDQNQNQYYQKYRPSSNGRRPPPPRRSGYSYPPEF